MKKLNVRIIFIHTIAILILALITTNAAYLFDIDLFEDLIKYLDQGIPLEKILSRARISGDVLVLLLVAPYGSLVGGYVISMVLLWRRGISIWNSLISFFAAYTIFRFVVVLIISRFQTTLPGRLIFDDLLPAIILNLILYLLLLIGIIRIDFEKFSVLKDILIRKDKHISQIWKEFEVGKRKEITAEEMERWREYQRSLLPSDIRFPKKGDLFESLMDQRIILIIPKLAPYTGSGEGDLLTGEKIWIHSDPSDNAISVYAMPVNYKDLESRMVSLEERESPDYDGFYFSIDTIDLNKNFKLINTDFSKEPFK